MEHIEYGDGAQGWSLCPLCDAPTAERWDEIQKIKHRSECGCRQYVRNCPYYGRRPKSKLTRRAPADSRFD
jgi:hypothetical protein